MRRRTAGHAAQGTHGAPSARLGLGRAQLGHFGTKYDVMHMREGNYDYE